MTVHDLLAAARARYTRLTPQEAYAAVGRGALLVDTRDGLQRRRFGTIPGALAIDRTVLEWRVGRIGKRGWYELDDYWKKEVAEGRAVDIPAEVFKEPGEYRVRARWRDDTGRCGHWSAPVEVRVR